MVQSVTFEASFSNPKIGASGVMASKRDRLDHWFGFGSFFRTARKACGTEPGLKDWALMRFKWLLMGSAVVALAAHAQGPLGLKNGEGMSYRVGWTLIPFVGRIAIAAEEVMGGTQKVIRVTTTTATRGIARGFYPFDARGESIFDAASGRLLVSSESSASNTKETKTSMVFDYARSSAMYTDDVRPENSKTVPMPAGSPYDLILGLVQTRSWDLKPGEQRDELVIFKDEFFKLTVHAVGYEEVETPIGTFKTLVLVPLMEKEPPKGMFKRGSTVRVWIAQDQRHLPVKFEVEFSFGRGIAVLTDYRPPAAETAAGHAPNPGP